MDKEGIARGVIRGVHREMVGDTICQPGRDRVLAFAAVPRNDRGLEDVLVEDRTELHGQWVRRVLPQNEHGDSVTNGSGAEMSKNLNNLGVFCYSLYCLIGRNF